MSHNLITGSALDDETFYRGTCAAPLLSDKMVGGDAGALWFPAGHNQPAGAMWDVLRWAHKKLTDVYSLLRPLLSQYTAIRGCRGDDKSLRCEPRELDHMR